MREPVLRCEARVGEVAVVCKCLYWDVSWRVAALEGGEPWWSTQTRPASNTAYYKQQQSKKMNADRTAADTGPPQQPYSSAHFPCSSPGGIAGP